MSVCDEIKLLLSTELKKQEAFLTKIRGKVGTLDEASQKEIWDLASVLREHGTSSIEGRIALSKLNIAMSSFEKVTYLEKVKALIRISTLLNPATMIRNVAGNALSVGISGIEESTIAPIIDKLTSLVTKQESNYAFSPFTKWDSYGKGFINGVKTWIRGYKEKVNLSLTTAGQLEIKGSGKIFRSNSPISKVLNTLDQTVRQGLALGDIPFFEAAMSARASELMKLGNTNKLTLEQQTEVMRYALDKVFMDKNKISETAGAIKRVTADIPGLNILMESFFPFVQTPGSILNKIADHTPIVLGKLVAQMGETHTTGKFDQRLFVDRVSKFISGTGILTLGTVLASKGIITPSPKKIGSKEQKFSELQGQREYQLKVGNNYYAINWADPVGTLFAMAADAYDRSKNEKGINKVTAAIEASGDAFISQSLFRTLINTLSGYDTTKNVSENLLLSTLIMEPTLLKKTAQAIDPDFVETYDNNILKSYYNRVIQYIPGLKETMPKRYNILGEIVKSDMNPAETLFSPSVRTKSNNRGILKEINRVFKSTSDVKVLPYIPSKKISYEGKQFTITNNKQFSDWQKILGQSQKAAYKSALNDTFYKTTDDDSSKAYIIQTYLDFFKEQAKEKFLKTVDNE
jgi:hypothetical protein